MPCNPNASPGAWCFSSKHLVAFNHRKSHQPCKSKTKKTCKATKRLHSSASLAAILGVSQPLLRLNMFVFPARPLYLDNKQWMRRVGRMGFINCVPTFPDDLLRDLRLLDLPVPFHAHYLPLIYVTETGKDLEWRDLLLDLFGACKYHITPEIERTAQHIIDQFDGSQFAVQPHEEMEGSVYLRWREGDSLFVMLLPPEKVRRHHASSLVSISLIPGGVARFATVHIVPQMPAPHPLFYDRHFINVVHIKPAPDADAPSVSTSPSAERCWMASFLSSKPGYCLSRFDLGLSVKWFDEQFNVNHGMSIEQDRHLGFSQVERRTYQSGAWLRVAQPQSGPFADRQRVHIIREIPSRKKTPTDKCVAQRKDEKQNRWKTEKTEKKWQEELGGTARATDEGCVSGEQANVTENVHICTPTPPVSTMMISGGSSASNEESAQSRAPVFVEDVILREKGCVLYHRRGKRVLIDTLSDPRVRARGGMIGWKLAALRDGTPCVVKLMIPEDARVVFPAENNFFSLVHKYRCSHALTLEVQAGELDAERALSVGEAYPFVWKSEVQREFAYRVGQMARSDAFDSNPGVMCANGIHFHTDRALAFCWLPQYKHSESELKKLVERARKGE